MEKGATADSFKNKLQVIPYSSVQGFDDDMDELDGLGNKAKLEFTKNML